MVLSNTLVYQLWGLNKTRGITGLMDELLNLPIDQLTDIAPLIPVQDFFHQQVLDFHLHVVHLKINMIK